MLLDGLGYDLEHYGGGVYELEDADRLDVVLDDQQGDHTGQEEARLELVLHFLREVGMQVRRVQRSLQVVDGWQGVWEVLHKREDLRGTQTHKLGEQVARELGLERLGRRVVGMQPSEQGCLEIELELFQERLIEAVFDLA